MQGKCRDSEMKSANVPKNVKAELTIKSKRKSQFVRGTIKIKDIMSLFVFNWRDTTGVAKSTGTEI